MEKVSTEERVFIYIDKDFLVLNKPAGILVHPAHTNTNEETLVDIIVRKYPEVQGVGDDPDIRPGIVHRLDRDTSGIMIVARTQVFFDYFKKMFSKP